MPLQVPKFSFINISFKRDKDGKQIKKTLNVSEAEAGKSEPCEKSSGFRRIYCIVNPSGVCSQVYDERNYKFLASFLATFATELPFKREFEAHPR